VGYWSKKGVPALSGIVGALVLTVAWAGPAWAGAQDTDRADLIDAYLKQARERPPLYQSAPVTHIVPEFNTVTYALDGHLYDTTVLPADLNKDPGGNGNSRTMTLKGYSVAPYVALSLKKVGLGFNVEAGRRSLSYDSKTGADEMKQQSTAVSRGLGIHVFFKFLDTKRLVATAIAGGRTINVRETIGPFVTTNAGVPTGTYSNADMRYTLNGYDGGLNLGVRLLKGVTLIPWGNYAYIDDSNPRSMIGNSTSTLTNTLAEDVNVFWHAEPSLNYGLDLAVRVGGVQVRLGGLFGMIVSMGSTSDQVKDNGFSLSFSWDQKG